MKREVEAIHGLSWAQHGMLLESLHPHDTGLYVEQLVCSVAGDLDTDRFASAWQRVLDRHPALRAAFIWREQSEPLQAVFSSVKPPLVLEDWRALEAVERERRLADFLVSDRLRNFNVSYPPLLRVSLFRVGDAEHRMLLTFHHLVLDGWSVPIILDDLLREYAKPGTKGAAVSFFDVLDWITEHETKDDEIYWCGVLEGHTEATPVGRLIDYLSDAPVEIGTGTIALEIDAKKSAQITIQCASAGVAVSTFFEAAWAILLMRYTGREDVTFGLSTAGRPADLAGVQGSVGMFVNSLPIRLARPEDTPFRKWVRLIQSTTMEAQEHQFLPMARLHANSEIPAGALLFESLMVFEGNKSSAPITRGGLTLHMQPDLSRGSETAYPVTLLVQSGDRHTVELVHDRRYLSDTEARRVLHDFETVLREVASSPSTPVDKVASHIESTTAPEFRRAPAIQHSSDLVPAAISPITDLVVTICAGVLGEPRLTAEARLLDYGGHSLRLVKISSRIHEILGVELPLRHFFEAPTISALARRVESRLWNGADFANVEPLKCRPATEVDELSPGQRRLWFLSRLIDRSAAYNVYMALRITGPLDLLSLRRAVDEIVLRHDVLRTEFINQNGEPVARVTACLDTFLNIVDLNDKPLPNREQVLREAVQHEIGRPISLDDGIPTRFTLLRFAEDDHAFVWTTHHIVADGESLELFRRELVELYDANTKQREPRLPDLAVRYADFAIAQSDWLTSSGYAQQVDYWRKQLSGILPVLELPADRGRPDQPSYRGGRVVWRVDQGFTDEIRTFSRRENSTVFMTVLAGFSTLLAHLTGQRDIIVGTPIAGRTRPEVSDLIGFFLNTVALRTAVNLEGGFRAQLRQVREVALSGYANQNVPFDVVVDAIAPVRDARFNPVYQVMLVQHVPSYEQRDGADRLVWEELEFGNGTAQLDFTIYLIDDPESGIVLEAEYSTDLFDTATAARFLNQLAYLMRSAIASPDTPLRDLPLLNSEDSGKVLDWARARPVVAGGASAVTIPAMFARMSTTCPDATALIDAGSGAIVTYSELNRLSQKLAAKLRELGAGPGRTLGVCVHRSPLTVVALLAVLRTGATCLPMDPNYPTARLTEMARECALDAVVTSDQIRSELVAGLRELNLHLVFAEHCDDATAQPDPPIDPASVAYIVYTSGATGKPKGVLTTHAAAADYLRAMNEDFGLSPADNVLQLASVSFDASIRDIFGPLTVGAQVVLLDQNSVRDPDRVLAAVAKHRVTALLSAVPSFLTAVTMMSSAHHRTIQSVRLVASSGETMHRAMALRVRELFGASVRVVNQYGPTETTMTATRHVVDWVMDDAIVPIGTPNPGMEVYVLDHALRPTAPGVSGEIFIGGPALSYGYLGAPGATAAAFLPSPLADRQGERLYRTGDLGQWTLNGTLTYLGRADHQLKIRGMRVEPGEIEALLAEHPRVAEAAVIATEAGNGELRLVAYAAGPNTCGLDGVDLRGHLLNRLPDHMVPSVFMMLDQLPVTPNGKLDRAALPEPVLNSVAISAARPRDQVDVRMVQLWEDVLGRAVEVDDDFFAVGGHSLLAVLLVDRVRKEFALDIPLAALYQAPTIMGLSDRIRSRGGAAKGTVIRLSRRQGESDPPLFLVHPQSGEVVSYVELARELSETTQIYGVGAVGYDTDEPALTTIEDMAAHYLRQICEIQPHGPYRLGGWSFGANVAFEIAQRLEAATERVEFLIVLDARVFGQDDLESWYARSTDMQKYGIVAGLDPMELVSVAEDIGLELLLERTGSVPGADLLSKLDQTNALRRMVNVFTANGHAADLYSPRGQINADIHLYRATAKHASLPTPPVRAEAWRELTVGRFTDTAVGGTHHDFLFAPNAEPMAAQLANLLARREEEGR